MLMAPSDIMTLKENILWGGGGGLEDFLFWLWQK